MFQAIDVSQPSLTRSICINSDITSVLYLCIAYRYQQEKQDYEKRVQQKIGSDRFASRYAQTVNWALKTKEVRQSTLFMSA